MRRKRCFDFVVGSVACIVAVPLIVVLAVVVATTLKANPLFVQERVGRDGRPFRILKLRTLPPWAPAYADKHAIRGVATPRVCRMLRASHLDELPQLLLVPIGRLSLVGPRPELRFGIDGADPQFAELRTSVPQGCTGLWQISDRTNELLHETPEFDRLYVERWSLRMDAWILARTVTNFLRLTSPVTIEQVPRWVYGRGLVGRLTGAGGQPPRPTVDRALGLATAD